MKVARKGMGALLLIAGLWGSQAMATEISLLRGLYKTEKVDGGLEATTIHFGGRYGLPEDGRGFWFGQLYYAQTSYSGNPAPDSDSTLRVGGGRRYTYEGFTNRIEPYISWLAEIRQESQGSTDISGLFYSGYVGLRLRISPKFFVDLESTLFESALTATVETDNAGNKTKTTRTELDAATVGSFANVAVSVGMRL